MAIAPLDLDPRYEALDMPWPRPALRLVVPAGEDWEDGGDADWDGDGTGPEWEEPEPPAAAVVRTGATTPRRGVDVSARRRRRRTALRRRRALTLGAGAVLCVVLLALPLRALGGAAPTPRPADPGSAGTTYVVQPGDTEWSIATRLDGGGDPRALASAIARETGSAVVVPGERIAIP